MTSPSDLDRFREALERQQSELQEAARDTRFKPPTDLASALLLFDGASGSDSSEPIVGDILDLSSGGMRVAILVGFEVQVGQICSLRFDPSSGEHYQLRGEVRWVDRSSYITVFGLCLNQASCSGDD
ncbi:MAG: PilZ domain-containing protein [Synechococcaceae cyanobacterium]|nr:PilZ domain-containing protein [Synechococcaceae cyanobacterium]